MIFGHLSLYHSSCHRKSHELSSVLKTLITFQSTDCSIGILIALLSRPRANSNHNTGNTLEIVKRAYCLRGCAVVVWWPTVYDSWLSWWWFITKNLLNSQGQAGLKQSCCTWKKGPCLWAMKSTGPYGCLGDLLGMKDDPVIWRSK